MFDSRLKREMIAVGIAAAIGAVLSDYFIKPKVRKNIAPRGVRR